MFVRKEGLSSLERDVLEHKLLGPVSSIYLAAAVIQNGSMGEITPQQKDGYYTELPPHATILKVKKSKDTIIVDYNSALESYGGGASRVQALVGQIVYSFTELPGISKVKITVNGATEIVLGGEGFVIDKPLKRSDLSF